MGAQCLPESLGGTGVLGAQVCLTPIWKVYSRKSLLNIVNIVQKSTVPFVRKDILLRAWIFVSDRIEHLINVLLLH